MSPALSQPSPVTFTPELELKLTLRTKGATLKEVSRMCTVHLPILRKPEDMLHPDGGRSHKEGSGTGNEEQRSPRG